MAELTERVRAGLVEVRRRIAAGGGDPEAVRVIAVTKGFGIEAVRAAAEAGCGDVGENYAEELLAKAGAAEGLRVHFLGGIQRKKVARLAADVDLWHSVDRLEEGRAIAAHRPGATILVQVSCDRPQDVAGRGGVELGRAAELVEALGAEPLVVAGLMAVGPPPPADPRPAFERVAALWRELGLAELSMGMSQDLEAAVAAGATMVRIGTALFGPRPAKTVAGAPRQVG